MTLEQKKKKMKNNYQPIGDYIRDVNNRNKDLETTNLLGINISNNFMPSVANRSGLDLSKYKLITKNQFATNIMHVGRDERLPIALYRDDKPSIVSPAYKTFEIVDEEELLPEYLMIELERSEFHRLAWYYCDSSVRGGLVWDRFKDIKIPVLPIEEQRKYVAIYKGLLDNQKVYENSFEDLQLICDTYIEDLIQSEEPKVLGEYIEAVDERNKELEIDNLLGISVEKIFIPSKSNKKRLNLSNYKIVKEGQFGYVTVTSRNGDKISLAILNGESGLISSTYMTFQVKNKSELLPEYLYLFFRRTEFDRYARFHSWGSARETFTWEDMCNVKLPIPSIEKQKAIVTIYHTLETRKQINEDLKSMIKPLCPVLMRGVVEEMKNDI